MKKITSHDKGSLMKESQGCLRKQSRKMYSLLPISRQCPAALGEAEPQCA